MADSGWTFWVHLIKDGERTGLLLKRQAMPNGDIQTKYFFSGTPEGLVPNEHILRACDYSYARLEPRNDERRVMQLLTACAAVGGTQKRLSDTVPLNVVCSTDKYSEINRLFEDGEKGHRNAPSELRRFLISYDVFSRFVLKKKRGADVLEIRAKEFRVLPLATLIFRNDFHYLRPIDQVLRVGEDLSPEWFRKEGPIAADFDAGYVFRRTKTLGELSMPVQNSPMFLLHGPSATGKSIIVRTLANDLRDSMPVYYFTCAEDRYFEHTRLLDEIRTATGLVIIEDIHLAPDKIEYVCSRLEGKDHPPILFTGRHSFRDGQHHHGPNLALIPSTELLPLENVDGLIDQFIHSQSLPDLSPEARLSVKEASADSFWFLAYALVGYRDHRGRSVPAKWLVDGVRDDLRRLERIKSPTEPYAAQYPQILVAIAPLYRREVLTAQTFLTHTLGFAKDALNELVARCEITRHDIPEGEVLYGLRHSGLADAYWEYGKAYRHPDVPANYQQCIYDYAVAETPNGLEALACTDADTRTALFKKCEEQGVLPAIIERETSIDAMNRWLSIGHPGLARDSHLTEIIVRKLDSQADARQMATAIVIMMVLDDSSAWPREVVGHLSPRVLAQRACEETRPKTIEMVLSIGQMHSDSLAKQICRKLDSCMVGAILATSTDTSKVVACGKKIRELDYHKWEDICRELDVDNLLRHMACSVETGSVLQLLAMIIDADEGIARNILECPQVHDLFKRLVAATDVGDADSDVSMAYIANHKRWKDFLNKIELPRIHTLANRYVCPETADTFDPITICLPVKSIDAISTARSLRKGDSSESPA